MGDAADRKLDDGDWASFFTAGRTELRRTNFGSVFKRSAQAAAADDLARRLNA
jgi:hypothetical protein